VKATASACVHNNKNESRCSSSDNIEFKYVQVILGYVLLGALLTRFAVLFTAGGPAGKFSPAKKKKKQRMIKQAKLLPFQM
jgi:hypothetical protein